MKSVPKIFTDQPKLTDADIKRLSPHLGGWNKLCEILLMDTLSDDDLKKLILLERSRTKPRVLVLRKLVARLLTRTRVHLMDALTT